MYFHYFPSIFPVPELGNMHPLCVYHLQLPSVGYIPIFNVMNSRHLQEINIRGKKVNICGKKLRSALSICS